MAADDRVVVQGDLIRFGLAQYDEMGKLRQEIVGATDATVATALDTGALTGVALDGAVAELMTNPSALRTATNSTLVPRISNTSVTYDSNGNPSVETLTTPSGTVVKTYHWDGSGNPTTCDWNMPTGPDYVETFTYSGGNATGSTFQEV